MYYIFSPKLQFLLLHAVLLSYTKSMEENGAITKSGATIQPWAPATSANPAASDLHKEYNNIFKHGNRNAASHLWATFLLQRSSQMTVDRLKLFFQGFCSVSGSPVRPSDYTRYRVTLPQVNTSRNLTGFMYYCCWPCICDTQDFIRVDTLTVKYKDGVSKKQNFAVIGNPCDDPAQLQEPFMQPFYGGRITTLAETAQEVRCGEDGALEGATISDHGNVIIGMFFDAIDIDTKSEENGGLQGYEQRTVTNPTPGRISNAMVFENLVQFHDETEWHESCSDRARDGYNSGMGEIFRKVSAISPILPTFALDEETVHYSSNTVMN